MKTKSKNQKHNSGLSIRPEQLSTEPKTSKKLPRISLKRRFTNRALPTEKLLELLSSEAPRFFELAEVVGKWVWIQFSDKQTSNVTRELAELGFHWNNNRQTWQHPCGTIADDRANYDPRERYGSYFPAQEQAA